MTSVEYDQAGYWDEAIAQMPTGHVLQTFEWGEVKKRYGWEPMRLLFRRGGYPVAAASVLRKKLTLLPWSIMYVAKGPCLDPQDRPATLFVLDHLKKLAQQEGALLIKVDPDIGADDQETAGLLLSAGFIPSREQVQFINTMIVDLRPPVENLYKSLHSSTRRNIRLAQKKGVCIKDGSEADFALFYDVYEETSRRDGFIIRSFDYYQFLWWLFWRHGMAKVFLAEYENEVLAGCIIMHLGRKAWYMFGSSRGSHRELNPNHLLQWEIIRWAKEAGIEVYDMWGLPAILEPGQPMWGLVQFKQGFGGRVQRWAGAYDYVPMPTLYRGWAWANRFRLWTGLFRARLSRSFPRSVPPV
ncbi:MAG: peptidoglycan bridge formation glycyltransferase FemA/FemB family protein [Chloroflexi bacterium]|nr:peptidoglycan bridge formation glycyltransferase FemA/FemB family protein [Chloroflexota bacterium]